MPDNETGPYQDGWTYPLVPVTGPKWGNIESIQDVLEEQTDDAKSH